MFDQSTVRDELQSLKADLTRLLDTTGEEILNSSRSHAQTLAEQLREALTDFGEVLSQEEGQFDKLVAGRPVASLASAFALGVVVGMAVRRH